MRVTLLSKEVQGRIDNKWWQLPRASRLLAQCDVAFDPKMWIPEKVLLLRVTQIKERLTEINITYRYIDDQLPAIILKIVCSTMIFASKLLEPARPGPSISDGKNHGIFKIIEFFESHPKASAFKRNSLIWVTQM